MPVTWGSFVFARETAGDYRLYYLKDGSLHSVVKGDSEIWHCRRTGGKAPPFFGASYAGAERARAQHEEAEGGRAQHFVKPYRVCRASIDAVPLARLLFARSGARAFARAIAIP